MIIVRAFCCLFVSTLKLKESCSTQAMRRQLLIGIPMFQLSKFLYVSLSCQVCKGTVEVAIFFRQLSIAR
jgi:hypothetical protein